MSHPVCKDVRMKSEDAAEPVEWDVEDLTNTLHEWASLASLMIEHLVTEADLEKSANWRPHLDQIVKTVASFRDHCREGSRCLGLCREDELHDAIWNEADRLVKWLTRMMNIEPT